MSKRWTIKKRKPSAREQSATRHTQALADCQHGKHTLTNTFRPGEQVCLTCNVVFYCPGCLQQSNLAPLSRARVFALACPAHRKTEVQV